MVQFRNWTAEGQRPAGWQSSETWARWVGTLSERYWQAVGLQDCS